MKKSWPCFLLPLFLVAASCTKDQIKEQNLIYSSTFTQTSSFNNTPIGQLELKNFIYAQQQEYYLKFDAQVSPFPMDSLMWVFNVYKGSDKRYEDLVLHKVINAKGIVSKKDYLIDSTLRVALQDNNYELITLNSSKYSPMDDWFTGVAFFQKKLSSSTGADSIINEYGCLVRGYIDNSHAFRFALSADCNSNQALAGTLIDSSLVNGKLQTASGDKPFLSSAYQLSNDSLTLTFGLAENDNINQIKLNLKK
jgi:hypothetical protein